MSQRHNAIAEPFYYTLNSGLERFFMTLLALNPPTVCETSALFYGRAIVKQFSLVGIIMFDKSI